MIVDAFHAVNMRSGFESRPAHQNFYCIAR